MSKNILVDEARNTANEGSGFGLSITKRVIELHKRTLTAKRMENLLSLK